MINITYSADQKALAEKIRDDLALADYQPAHPVLLVLVSAESNSDPSVQDEIKRAIQKGIHIVPILAERVALPEQLDRYKPVNFIGGYKRRPLMTHLAHTTMTADDVKASNRRALLVVGGIALIMFFVGIFGIMSGMVQFPVEEYNEEATFQAQWIDGLIGETLQYVQPKTTEDAVNFQSTLEVAPTRLYLYIKETATALPKQGD